MMQLLYSDPPAAAAVTVSRMGTLTGCYTAVQDHHQEAVHPLRSHSFLHLKRTRKWKPITNIFLDLFP